MDASKTHLGLVQSAIAEHIAVMEGVKGLAPLVAELGLTIAHRLRDGGKVLWMGNGGSAADCQHLAAEIVGRFVKERRALPSVALTTDTSILTAVGNDYGFEQIFSRQIDALCQPNDVVVGISTSGNSSNVVKGMEAAKALGALTVAMTGGSGGLLASLCDVSLVMPTAKTARIQEGHILLGHILCECIDAHY